MVSSKSPLPDLVEVSLAELAVEEIVALPSFLRGDCNADGVVDLSDAVTSLNALFIGGVQDVWADACDANDDGVEDVSDAFSTASRSRTVASDSPRPSPGVNEKK